MVKHTSIITKSPQETAELGKKMGAFLSLQGRGTTDGARILCLYGDLGSGKTTFTQGFAQGLGIGARLLSPTFIIVRRYDIPDTSGFLYHMDLYRLNTEQQLQDVGLAEIFTENHSCVVIEWAEKLGKLLPLGRTDVTFALAADGSHAIDIKEYI
jgi:tRNA threonylcarbamoyladenosine biosynthesis protein TsaE